jgi:hypothetical protein
MDTGIIKSINLVIKIKNQQQFMDLFTDHSTNKNYHPEKGTIKINLGDDIVKYLNDNFENLDINIEKICDLNYLHNFEYSVLQTIGNVYMYITYKAGDRKLINVYGEEDIIHFNDFVEDPRCELNKYSDIICATISYSPDKTEYITKYFKMFFNNNSNITPEIMLLNYDQLNTNLLNCKMIIVQPNGIKKHSIDSIL